MPQAQHFVCRNAFEVIVQTRVEEGLSPISKHREKLKIQGEAEWSRKPEIGWSPPYECLNVLLKRTSIYVIDKFG